MDFMPLFKELIGTIGFPAVIVIGMGMWLRKHIDSLIAASLEREKAAMELQSVITAESRADRMALGERITSLEDRQFTEVTAVVKESMEVMRASTSALNKLISSIASAPCGVSNGFSDMLKERAGR